MDEILHHLRNYAMMIPLQIPTNNGFTWFSEVGSLAFGLRVLKPSQVLPLLRCTLLRFTARLPEQLLDLGWVRGGPADMTPWVTCARFGKGRLKSGSWANMMRVRSLEMSALGLRS